MAFTLAELTVPVIAAPMAGGPSTPALAAAVTEAGGLGFVAGGYLSSHQLADQIAAARAATSGPIGVNLFVPQPSPADLVQLDEYAVHLETMADHYDVEIGHPQAGDDFWPEKLELIADVRPQVVSFTFGTPDPAALEMLQQLHILTLVTVTSVYEAGVALGHGADGLIVQGPEAGGHRGTFAPDTEPGTEPLRELLAAIRAAHGEVDLVASGGLGSADRVAGALRDGAVAVQVGTALLLADEAGTHEAYRGALRNPAFNRTTVTRAFSGRYARGLENDFTRAFDDLAPAGYPQINQMTRPIRAAAAARSDPQGMSLWAGTAYRDARPGPAAEIIAGLARADRL